MSDEYLDRAWLDSDIVGRQRELVDRQLQAMRDNAPPEHFVAAGKALQWVLNQDRLVPEQPHLLDAGCASGYYYEIFEHFAPGQIKYTGVDFNPWMIRLAQERYPGVEFVVDNLCSLQFLDRCFYIIFSGAALMHIKDWKKALGELKRVCSRWLILHRTWVFTSRTPARYETRDAWGVPAWYIRFNEQELIGTLSEDGFTLDVTIPSGEVGEGPDAPIVTYVFRGAFG